ncbi:MAG: hypothetical protein QW791_04510 [Candidatus Bathyarchaeia archaeon]
MPKACGLTNYVAGTKILEAVLKNPEATQQHYGSIEPRHSTSIRALL